MRQDTKLSLLYVLSLDSLDGLQLEIKQNQIMWKWNMRKSKSYVIFLGMIVLKKEKEFILIYFYSCRDKTKIGDDDEDL